MMIIGSDRKHEIGKIYNTGPLPLIEPNGNMATHVQYMVMEEATREEYIESVEKDLPPGKTWELDDQCVYFYRISID